MNTDVENLLSRLAAGTKLGYSLNRQFYCDDAVFAADMEQVVSRKWLVAGHVDRVRNKGDYFLFKIGDESIIIVRSATRPVSVNNRRGQRWVVSICISPRSISPLAGNGTFGWPACRPLRQVLRRKPSATVGSVEKNWSRLRRM